MGPEQVGIPTDLPPPTARAFYLLVAQSPAAGIVSQKFYENSSGSAGPPQKARRNVTPRSAIITTGPNGTLPKVVPPGLSAKITRKARTERNRGRRIVFSPHSNPQRIWSRARKAIGIAIAARS